MAGNRSFWLRVATALAKHAAGQVAYRTSCSAHIARTIQGFNDRRDTRARWEPLMADPIPQIFSISFCRISSSRISPPAPSAQAERISRTPFSKVMPIPAGVFTLTKRAAAWKLFEDRLVVPQMLGEESHASCIRRKTDRIWRPYLRNVRWAGRWGSKRERVHRFCLVFRPDAGGCKSDHRRQYPGSRRASLDRSGENVDRLDKRGRIPCQEKRKISKTPGACRA